MSHSKTTDSKEKLHEAQDQIKNYSQALGEQLGELASHATDKAEEYNNDVRDYIRKNPYKSIAIAAAAGLALAGMIHLLSKKRD